MFFSAGDTAKNEKKNIQVQFTQCCRNVTLTVLVYIQVNELILWGYVRLFDIQLIFVFTSYEIAVILIGNFMEWKVDDDKDEIASLWNLVNWRHFQLQWNKKFKKVVIL